MNLPTAAPRFPLSKPVSKIDSMLPGDVPWNHSKMSASRPRARFRASRRCLNLYVNKRLSTFQAAMTCPGPPRKVQRSCKREKSPDAHDSIDTPLGGGPSLLSKALAVV